MVVVVVVVVVVKDLTLSFSSSVFSFAFDITILYIFCLWFSHAAAWFRCSYLSQDITVIIGSTYVAVFAESSALILSCFCWTGIHQSTLYWAAPGRIALQHTLHYIGSDWIDRGRKTEASKRINKASSPPDIDSQTNKTNRQKGEEKREVKNTRNKTLVHSIQHHPAHFPLYGSILKILTGGVFQTENLFSPRLAKLKRKLFLLLSLQHFIFPPKTFSPLVTPFSNLFPRSFL